MHYHAIIGAWHYPNRRALPNGTGSNARGTKRTRKAQKGGERVTVVAENHRAIRSYEKVGFEREGLSRENYFGEDGKYHDEVQMGLIVGPAEEGEGSE